MTGANPDAGDLAEFTFSSSDGYRAHVINGDPQGAALKSVVAHCRLFERVPGVEASEQSPPLIAVSTSNHKGVWVLAASPSETKDNVGRRTVTVHAKQLSTTLDSVVISRLAPEVGLDGDGLAHEVAAAEGRDTLVLLRPSPGMRIAGSHKDRSDSTWRAGTPSSVESLATEASTGTRRHRRFPWALLLCSITVGAASYMAGFNRGRLSQQVEVTRLRAELETDRSRSEKQAEDSRMQLENWSALGGAASEIQRALDELSPIIDRMAPEQTERAEEAESER